MAVEQAVNEATNTVKGWGSYAWSTFKTLAPLTTLFTYAAIWIGGPAALAGKMGADVGAFDITKLSGEGVMEVGAGAWKALTSGAAAVAPHLGEMFANAPVPGKA